MADYSNRCLVSGADGVITVTPSGRVILTEVAPPLRSEDLDRIADEVGTDVVMRTLAANGGTAAMFEETDGPLRLTMSGRVAALIELPTAEWFVRPTGTADHVVRIPGDALRFAVALGALVPSDLTPNTAASLTAPEGQAASQFVVDLRVDAESDPTPVGLKVVDLSEAVDFVPEPLPIVHRSEPEQAADTPASQPSPQVPYDPPPTPAPVPDAASSSAPGVVVDVSDESAEEDESNWVLGIRCPLDHHNHPDAEYCSQCGRKMGINATAVFVKGPRPPVGLFLLDDGGAIPIATDLLIGRDATTHDEVRGGKRQAVLLTDPSNVVSRHHLAITLDDWTVTVADLGSANGTLVIDAQTGQSIPLAPHRAVPMGQGDRLQIGPRTLQLQLHHVAV